MQSPWNNYHLDPLTARDIDIMVTKVLRGLGKPEPPLNLDNVRALLVLSEDVEDFPDFLYKRTN